MSIIFWLVLELVLGMMVTGVESVVVSDFQIYGIWFIHVCEGGTLLRPLKTFLWTRTSIQVLETSNLVLSSATITIFFTLILMFNILKWPVTNGTGQILSYALYIVSFKGSALINGTHVILSQSLHLVLSLMDLIWTGNTRAMTCCLKFPPTLMTSICSLTSSQSFMKPSK